MGRSWTHKREQQIMLAYTADVNITYISSILNVQRHNILLYCIYLHFNEGNLS